MTVTNLVTIGDVLTAVAFGVAAIGSYYALKGQIQAIGEQMISHSNRMDGHEERMVVHETRLYGIVQDVQRLIGQQDANSQKRANHRP